MTLCHVLGAARYMYTCTVLGLPWSGKESDKIGEEMRREASFESDEEKYLNDSLSFLFNLGFFELNLCDMKAVSYMLVGRDDAPNPDMGNSLSNHIVA